MLSDQKRKLAQTIGYALHDAQRGDERRNLLDIKYDVVEILPATVRAQFRDVCYEAERTGRRLPSWMT